MAASVNQGEPCSVSVGNGMVCCRAALLTNTRYVSCVKKNLADANLVGG